MSKHKACWLILVALVSLSAGAQTKQPDKKSARSSSPMIVDPGTEKWGDIPAAALVGTPSVERGEK